MMRKMLRKDKTPDSLLSEAQDAMHLDRKDLSKVIRKLMKEDPDKHDDFYSIFLEARAAGHFLEQERQSDTIARLRCLVAVDQQTCQRVLNATTPEGSIMHALERFIADGTVNEQAGKGAMLQFVLSCSHATATSCLDRRSSMIQIINATQKKYHITEARALTARYAYFLMVDPFLVQRVREKERLPLTESFKLYQAVEKTGRSLTKVAMLRQWKDMSRDEINTIMENNFDNSLVEAKTEYLAQQLMKKHLVDRTQAKEELKRNNGNFEKADKACEAHMASLKKSLQTEAIVPTRDTKSAPNVTPSTRVISILGVDENDASPKAASPSLGDGWMVSDFYLWMNVLAGMGKAQEWITTMSPKCLMNKYGHEDKVTIEDIEDRGQKPVQTKWATGFLHGDPFEDRKVVLDEAIAARLQDKVTRGPKGKALRGFFLERLEATVAEAARWGDKVLIIMFSHGDYDPQGGVCLGVDADTYELDDLLKPSHVSTILTKYPTVKCTIYMTSCFSGHWVESTEFSGNQIKPVILAAAEGEQESFGFVWSHSQRHAGGLFSAATISELLQEPIELPKEVEKDASREYRQVINSLVCEMHRLCLPYNIDYGYGSSPMFTDNESPEKFWRRTGYRLHNYRANYDKLKTVPASDPHPKRDRKRFHADFVDGKDPAIVAWTKRHPGIKEDDFPEATGGYGSTLRGLVSIGSMRYLIRVYLASNPGFHTQEHGILMQTIRSFLGNTLDHDKKIILRQQLMHRLQTHRDANQHCKLLGLYRLPIIEKWTPAQTGHLYDYHKVGKFAAEIAHSGLYDYRSGERRGPYYRKPSQYLAAAMMLAGYTFSEVQKAIKKLLMQRFGDSLTSQHVKTAKYSGSIARVKTLLRERAGTARTAPQGRGARPALSGITWY